MLWLAVREDADRYVTEAYSSVVYPTPESPLEFKLRVDLVFSSHLALVVAPADDCPIREAYSSEACPTPESPIEFRLKLDFAFGYQLA